MADQTQEQEYQELLDFAYGLAEQVRAVVARSKLISRRLRSF